MIAGKVQMMNCLVIALKIKLPIHFEIAIMNPQLPLFFQPVISCTQLSSELNFKEGCCQLLYPLPALSIAQTVEGQMVPSQSTRLLDLSYNAIPKPHI